LGRVARVRPGGGGLGVAWVWDADGETTRETENLEARGGESARGPARGEEITGAGVGGSRFPELQVFRVS
jgi:hypothetical protein